MRSETKPDQIEPATKKQSEKQNKPTMKIIYA